MFWSRPKLYTRLVVGYQEPVTFVSTFAISITVASRLSTRVCVRGMLLSRTEGHREDSRNLGKSANRRKSVVGFGGVESGSR